MNIQVKEEVPKLRYTKVHKGSSKKKCKYHLLMDFFTTYSGQYSGHSLLTLSKEI